MQGKGLQMGSRDPRSDQTGFWCRSGWGVAINRSAPRYPAMQRYDIVHSHDGEALDVLSTIAVDLEQAWLIARQTFPQAHLIVLSADEQD